MTVRYTADLEQIAAHVDRARLYAGQVDETLARLERVVAALHLTWAGQAAEAHRVAHREWSRGARDVSDALEVLGAAARKAHDDYHAAASANHEMWSALA